MKQGSQKLFNFSHSQDSHTSLWNFSYFHSYTAQYRSHFLDPSYKILSTMSDAICYISGKASGQDSSHGNMGQQKKKNSEA